MGQKLDPKQFVYEDLDGTYYRVNRVQVLDAGDNVIADSAAGDDWPKLSIPFRYHAEDLGEEIPEELAEGMTMFDAEHNPEPLTLLPMAISAAA